MANCEVCMSASATPCFDIAAMTFAIAAELASSASRAVSASRVTVSVNRAMSGAILTLPSPTTTRRGC